MMPINRLQSDSRLSYSHPVFPLLKFHRCRLFLSLSLFTAQMVGCGSGALSTSNPGTPPPHDGTLVFLPDKSCFIEIVKKDGKAPISAEVAFYFYRDVNFTIPYEPMPETGELKIDIKRIVKLHPEEDALVTPTGPVLFGGKDVEGDLCFDLDGEVKKIPLGIR